MTTMYVGHVAECVCDDCWLARRRQTLAYRASGLGWTHTAIDHDRADRHGRSLYKQGCRCDVCRDAQSVYGRNHRHKISRRVGL